MFAAAGTRVSRTCIALADCVSKERTEVGEVVLHSKFLGVVLSFSVLRGYSCRGGH